MWPRARASRLHAGVSATGSEREKLEHLARYIARPPGATSSDPLSRRLRTGERAARSFGAEAQGRRRPSPGGENRARASPCHVLGQARLKRVFAIDIEHCFRRAGTLRLIASIEEPDVIERILEHLDRDAAPVDPAHPSRGPPRPGIPGRPRSQLDCGARAARAGGMNASLLETSDFFTLASGPSG
jgi:hypothetical protein